MPPNGVIDFMRSNEAQLSAIRPAKPSLAPEVSWMFDNSSPSWQMQIYTSNASV